jgi:hypothetical protein
VIQEWLAERGLEFNEDKTHIVHIDDGFNFLGFHLRRYKGMLLPKPQKEKVLAKLIEIRAWLRMHIHTKQEECQWPAADVAADGPLQVNAGGQSNVHAKSDFVRCHLLPGAEARGLEFPPGDSPGCCHPGLAPEPRGSF